MKSADKVYLNEVVEIMDGTDLFDRCGLGLKKCSDKAPCPIHTKFKQVKADIWELLSTKSVAQLANDVEKGLAIISV